MILKYKDNLPIVRITVSGIHSQKEIAAHIDFASSVTIVPYDVCRDLRLEFKAFASTATGGGTVQMPLYKAGVTAFNKNFDIYVGVLDLPTESKIRALLGRDILDSFKVCLDGRKKEITVI